MAEDVPVEANSDWSDDDAGEDETGIITTAEVSHAVVTGTDWTTETILSQLRRGNIRLNPRFQRRDAWDRARKSRFIESLLLNLPIPQLVLAEDRSRRGAFIVLDGKQRLLSLRQFAVGSQVGGADDEDYERLRLQGLEVREDLLRKSLLDIEQDPGRVDDLNSFLNQPIRTVVVRNWDSEDFLHLVFLRLNTGSVSLSPQELRQALHPGPFTDFVDDYSSGSESIRKALNLKKPDFRMRDVEVALRFFAFTFFYPSYRGELKDFLDDTTGTLNREWGRREDEVRYMATQCDEAIEATFEIFEKNAFRRWTGNAYNPQFNRAVFDIMAYYFRDEAVRGRALERPADVKLAFEQLCTKDREFSGALQSTTKTISATNMRLNKWGSTLGEILEIELAPVGG